MSAKKEKWHWVRVGNAPWTPSKLSKNGHPLIAERGMTYELGPRIPTPDEPWQTVPVELTETMERDGCEEGATAYADADGIAMSDAWAAMLKAAPKP